MARKKGKDEQEFSLDDERIPPQETQESEPEFVPEDVQVMRLAAEYAGNSGVKLRIYREGKGGYRDLTLLEEMDPTEFSPMMLREEPYNGGKFRLHFVSPTGLVANRGLTIAPRPANHQNANGIVQLQGMILEGFQKLAEAIKPVATQVQPSRRELLEEMQLMAAMFQPKQQAAPDPMNAFAMLREVMALSKTLTPSPAVATDGNGEVNTTVTLLNLADKYFGNLLEAKKQQSTQPVLPSPDVIPFNQPAAISEDETVIQMKAFAKMLCSQAAINGDVELYANMILDNADEQQILEFINKPDWFESLSSFAPDVSKYRAWFDELRSALIEMTTPEPAETSGTLTETGTSGNVALDVAQFRPFDGTITDSNVPAKS